MPSLGSNFVRKERPLMANASVEKLKALALRQGEKAVVGIAATILVVCLGLAFSKPMIPTSPAELQKKAENADSNLGIRQDPEAILSKIEEAGIKDPGFVKIVESQTINALKPSDYRVKLDWVIPEPGAGLIRDQPELIAPTELAVFPGRGGVQLYSLNDKGERIVDKSALAVNGGRPGGRGLYGRGGGPSERPEAAQKRQEAEKQKMDRLLAGKSDAAKDKDAGKEKAEGDKDKEKAEADAADPASVGPWVEETKGKRWVVITGVVDNEQMNKNWLTALKNPAIAFPQYVKVDAERQARQSEGEWSDWIAVDDDARYKVLDNLTEGDEEIVPAPIRPEALVDPLPFLRAGYWSGVHVARLVPPEVLNAPAANVNMGVGRGSASMGMMGGSGSKGMGMMGGGGEMANMMGGRSGGSMRSGFEGAMGGTSAGSTDEAVVPNTEKTLMLRLLDFSIEPNFHLSLPDSACREKPQLRAQRCQSRGGYIKQEPDRPLERSDGIGVGPSRRLGLRPIAFARQQARRRGDVSGRALEPGDRADRLENRRRRPRLPGRRLRERPGTFVRRGWV